MLIWKAYFIGMIILMMEGFLTELMAYNASKFLICNMVLFCSISNSLIENDFLSVVKLIFSINF